MLCTTHQTTCVSFRIIDIPALFAGPLPELGIDFAEVRPKWLVAVGAAALLAMGRPISGSHRFPDNFHVGIPLTAGSSAKTQVRTSRAQLGNLTACHGLLRGLTGALRLLGCISHCFACVHMTYANPRAPD